MCGRVACPDGLMNRVSMIEQHRWRGCTLLLIVKNSNRSELIDLPASQSGGHPEVDRTDPSMASGSDSLTSTVSTAVS